jgi:hypothetical protein
MIGGDVVYSHVHTMTAGTSEESRKDGLPAVDAIPALRPKIMVTGHTRVGEPDVPENVEASQ